MLIDDEPVLVGVVPAMPLEAVLPFEPPPLFPEPPVDVAIELPVAMLPLAIPLFPPDTGPGPLPPPDIEGIVDAPAAPLDIIDAVMLAPEAIPDVAARVVMPLLPPETGPEAPFIELALEVAAPPWLIDITFEDDPVIVIL